MDCLQMTSILPSVKAAGLELKQSYQPCQSCAPRNPLKAVIGPRRWNAIPKNVKCHQTMEGFKNALNMFLRKRVRDLPLL